MEWPLTVHGQCGLAGANLSRVEMVSLSHTPGGPLHKWILLLKLITIVYCVFNLLMVVSHIEEI